MNSKLSANMCDVAKDAGVSQATVSRVLRQNPAVSPETRARVLKSMRKLGYMSNVTSLLYNIQTKNMRFLIYLCIVNEERDAQMLELPYFKDLAFSIQNALQEEGHTCRTEILAPQNNDVAKHLDADGVFLLGDPSVELRKNFRDYHIPYVIVSDDVYSDTEDLVSVNNYYSCRMVAQKLLEQGFRTFGFILADFHAEHLDGFVGEIVRHRLPLDYSMIHVTSKYRLEAEYMQILQGWLEANKLPQILVVSFGPVANNVQNFLSSHHIRIPEDIQIICFTRYEYARFCYSVIESHPKKMGEIGVQRMLAKCKSPDDSPTSIIVPNSYEELCP